MQSNGCQSACRWAVPIAGAAGKAFTFTTSVLLLHHVAVAVKVTDPAATPVTNPALVTVARLLRLQSPIVWYPVGSSSHFHR